ncbi:hypothetical protein Dimus_006341, partial [Dionaea muscipula]
PVDGNERWSKTPWSTAHEATGFAPVTADVQGWAGWKARRRAGSGEPRSIDDTLESRCFLRPRQGLIRRRRRSAISINESKPHCAVVHFSCTIVVACPCAAWCHRLLWSPELMEAKRKHGES